MSVVEDLVRIHERLATARAPWESEWQSLSRLVLPNQGSFTSRQSPGARRDRFSYDDTAKLALQRFSAAVEGFLAPRTQRWHGLSATDPALNADPAVARYFEDVTNILFGARYAAAANFSSALGGCIQSLGAFGTAALWAGEDMGRGLWYRHVPLAEVFIEQDDRGRIVRVHRRFELTAQQAASAFGAAALPQAIRGALDAGRSDTFTFVQMIGPRDEHRASRPLDRLFPLVSYTVHLDSKMLIRENGFSTMPLIVSRYATADGETYGRSVAMAAKSTILMLQEIKRSYVRAMHKTVDPPLLVADDGVFGAPTTVPGGLNYGGLDAQGQPRVRPLGDGANLIFVERLLDGERSAVNDAFLINLFEVLRESGSDRMTATEVLERVREKGVLLTPTIGRQEAELLGPLIERELDILARAGQLPVMPPVLEEARGEYAIVYTNPLSKAQRASEAAGFFRLVDALGQMAQFAGPEVFDIIDQDAAARMLADVNAVPPTVLNAPDVVAAIRDARAQQQEAAALAEAAPKLAQAEKLMAEAQRV